MYNREYAIKCTILFYLSLTGILILGSLEACMRLKQAPGANGVNGHTPVVTTSPATYDECPNGGVEVTVDGTNTTDICNGAQGNVGPQGPVGAPGSPGLNAQPVTLIQLCPGIPTYPSTFIEFGICLQGELYGVYSQNDGFLALLPPGSYTSDGINSTCNLTVLPNCEVTNP
jgi:hypothetical protein